MDRQEYWLNNGYTREQIDNYLRSERIKSKTSRERKTKNNLKNKELIKHIRKDLVGNIFKICQSRIKILSINPTVDGQGFWFKINKTFSDGSSGDYRYFYDFVEYSKTKFIKYLKIC